MKLIRKFAWLTVLVMAVSLLGGCGIFGKDTSNALGRIEAAGEIVVGVSPDYPPFAFINTPELENDEVKYAGIDIELMKHVAKQLGVKLVIKAVNFESLMETAQSGRCDLVISALQPDPTRTFLTYTDPYYMGGRAGVIVRAEDASQIRSLSDLEGLKVALVQDLLDEKEEAKLADSGITYVDSAVKGLIRLDSYSVDAVVMPYELAKMYDAQDEDYTLCAVELGEASNPFVIGIVNNKDENGTAQLEERLAEILEQAAEDRLAEQWLEDSVKAAVKLNLSAKEEPED